MFFVFVLVAFFFFCSVCGRLCVKVFGLCVQFFSFFLDVTCDPFFDGCLFLRTVNGTRPLLSLS